LAWRVLKFSDAGEWLDNATPVLHEIMGMPDQGIPEEVLEHAKCVAIAPHMVRGGGFIFGAKGAKASPPAERPMPGVLRRSSRFRAGRFRSSESSWAACRRRWPGQLIGLPECSTGHQISHRDHCRGNAARSAEGDPPDLMKLPVETAHLTDEIFLFIPGGPNFGRDRDSRA